MKDNSSKKVYSIKDYKSKPDRKAWEWRWDLLQTFFPAYKNGGYATDLSIPAERLTIKGRAPIEIDSILNGLQKEGCFVSWGRITDSYKISGIVEKVLTDSYKQTGKVYGRFSKEYEKGIVNRNKKEKLKIKNAPDTFSISAAGGGLFVNDYLISKPYSTGSNLSLLEYAMENQNKFIKKKGLPQSLIENLDGKKFSKVWYELGLRGEILKVFVYKRSKGKFMFRQSVDKEVLKSCGIDISKLIKQLESANKINR